MADTPRAKPAKRPEIVDFGQKIGGARKDIAKTAPRRPKADKPTAPAYERQFIAMENRHRPGEWHLFAGAAKEGAVAAGTLAGFTLATVGATAGLIKAGVRASRAIPAVQMALMAAGAAQGAIQAKPGERLAGAAKGAWDSSLPGAVVNTAREISSAVSARRAMATADIDSGLTFERHYTKGPKAGQTETVRKAI